MFNQKGNFREVTNYWNENKTIDLLEETMAHLPSYYDNPSRHITTHMGFVVSNMDGIFKYRGGQAFEKITIDAFINFEDGIGNTIGVNSILTNKETTRFLSNQCESEKASKEVELTDIDILINSNQAIMCKTSLRERWKQVGYDVIKLNENLGEDNLNKYFFFFKEYPRKNTADDSIFQEIINQLRLSNIINVVSVYNEEKVFNSFKDILAETNKNILQGY